MENEQKSLTRRARLGRHVRGNLVGYVALFIAVSMTPLPSYAASVAVGTAGIKNGAVTTPKLAANAVTSAKIKDGTVRKVDLAAAARGFTSIVTKREGFAIGGSTTSTQTIVCPSGAVAIGGGAYVVPTLFALPGSTSGETVRSHPTKTSGSVQYPAATGVVPNGWRTVARNLSADPSTAYHYAICATK